MTVTNGAAPPRDGTSGAEPPGGRRVPAPLILMYHSVSSPPTDTYRMCVSVGRLAQHLRALARRGLRGVTVRELLAATARGAGGSLVGLTFDDGYADFSTNAAPLLERLGFGASLFVVTGSLGALSSWDADFRQPLLSVAQVQDLHRRGFEIGSHAVRHCRLSSLPERELRDELTGSRRALEDILQAPVDGLAYPYGDADETVQRAAAAAGYRYACLAEPTRPPSMYALPRVYLGQRDRPLQLLVKRQGYALIRRRMELIP
jgi:peptidoglycan/xylan/chitin deacetylase (PgdA/CDA1 family)